MCYVVSHPHNSPPWNMRIFFCQKTWKKTVDPVDAFAYCGYQGAICRKELHAIWGIVKRFGTPYVIIPINKLPDCLGNVFKCQYSP